MSVEPNRGYTPRKSARRNEKREESWIDPLEYVVISLSDQQHTRAALGVSLIQGPGQIRVVDPGFVMKAADGSDTRAQVKLLGELHASGVLMDEEFAREKAAF